MKSDSHKTPCAQNISQLASINYDLITKSSEDDRNASNSKDPMRPQGDGKTL